MALPANMRAVIAEAGKLVVTDRPVPAAGKGEVLVKIAATAINRADTLQRKGLYPVPAGVTDVLGLEMSGTVVKTGEGVTKWREGDEVMGLLSGGGYAEYTAVDEGLLMRPPKGFTLHEAAGIPETWLTAYQLLFKVGGLQAGEKVVIHAAASGVGTAATQLAVAHGGEVVATASSDEKLAVATKLGAKVGVNYKAGKWSEHEAVKNQANLILDPVAGADYTQQNLAALALDGRWVLYGLMGGATPTPEDNPKFPFLAALLRKRAHLLATTLRTRSLPYRQDLVRSFAENALAKFEDKTFSVVFDKREFDLASVQEAHEYMETNANIGKILVKVA